MSDKTKGTATMKQDKIVNLTDRDHILLRPGMYIGGIKSVSMTDFFLEGDKFVYGPREYIPGLIKIIFEPLDNAVDVAIKSNFKYANKIKIDIDSAKGIVTIEDNGYGISQEIDEVSGLSSVVLAVGRARSGSNFDDSVVRTHIGEYGVGVYLTNVYSKSFTCQTCDGKTQMTVSFTDNANVYTTSSKRSNKNGTIIRFLPDLERFGLTTIDETHISIIKQRLFILSVAYPEIDFFFNGEKIKFKNQKQFADMFGEMYELIPFNNGFIAYYPATSDEFTHFTVINGQVVKKGGTHIEFLNNKIVGFLREKLMKKYKDVKPSDIRNKLMLVAIFRNFPNADYDGQTKEEFANSAREISDYLSEIDFNAFGQKIFKNKEISEIITEIYRIREEFQKRKEMDKLDKKSSGKVKSDKYNEPIGRTELLFVCEGNSAKGGLMGELGRQNRGYFAIRGKLLNVLDAKPAEISSNVEITTLIQILGNGAYRLSLKPTGEYFKLTEKATGKIYTVHEDDLLKKDDGKWIRVASLNKNDYLFEPIDRTLIVPLSYFSQVEVNQPFISKYDYVVAATDQDMDGIHIRALILVFFNTLLLPLLKAGRLKYLNTPLIALKRGGKIVQYFFSFDEYNKFVSENPKVKGEWKYYKGLGSWAKGELKAIIDREGINKFLSTFEYDETTQTILTNWMSESTSDFRKEGIRNTQIDTGLA